MRYYKSGLVTFAYLLIGFCVSFPGWSADIGERIRWYDWGSAAFIAAQDQQKLLLINVGMEGCAACERMELLTYRNPDVVKLINQHYIAIAVDSEARPDIGERYSDWAWPATAFLKPGGEQVLAIAGNRLPRNFIPLLNDLNTRHEKGELKADSQSPYSLPSESGDRDLIKVRNQLRQQLDGQLNRTYGGWQGAELNTEGAGPRLEHLALRAHLADDKQLESAVLATINRFVDAQDPVWGGVYVVLVKQQNNKGFKVIPEKRISSQANAINAYALGYELTGKDKYRNAMSLMDQFMGNWFTSEDGGFYSNQKINPPGLGKNMTAYDYWALKTDTERRRYGIPPIDHVVYTDQNAEMILSYVHAFESFGDATYLDKAKRAAQFILRTRQHADGYLLQNIPNAVAAQDARLRPNLVEARPYLSTQVWLGSALLALYRATTDDTWLNQAIKIADTTQTLLQDPRGGFYGTREEHLPIQPRKPLEQNGRAANFYFDLSVYTKNKQYLETAEASLKALSDPQIYRREGRSTGEFATALEKLTANYVEFSIVGTPGDVLRRDLFKAAAAEYQPRKILHYEAPGRYPRKDQAALYICNPDRCSVPISDPSIVPRQAAMFRGPSSN